MKKFLLWILAVAMAASLLGCASGEAETQQLEELPTDDAAYVLDAGAVDTPLDGGGAAIAVVAGPAGVEDGGYYAAVWNGVRRFCQSFNFIPQSYAAADSSESARETALRQAAESGAGMVVCAGTDWEVPLYNIQNNYPTVSYLMLDGEPHNSDHSSYQTGKTVHGVLFREEQVGYLAGYAAVMEGYTQLGFLGAQTTPQNVRYGTGFLQGAEAAAELEGGDVSVKYWFCGTSTANEAITAKMSGWYGEGTQVIFAAGGNLAKSCTDAAAGTNGQVIAADYDQSALSDAVLTSSAKNFSYTIQNQLYRFYAAGASWGEYAGEIETLGVSAQAVGLSTAAWPFARFEAGEYRTLYDALQQGTTRVERYSDASTLPQTPALTVTVQN